MRRLKGFTLIELLIVVAIIAILAAIAVPNFLEAQVRSKVSRVRNDMRALATALESYHIDYNRPMPFRPVTAAGFTGPSVFYPGENGVSSRFIAVTTPVSYISSVFRDPFIPAAMKFSKGCTGTGLAVEYDTYDYVDSYTLSPQSIYSGPPGPSPNLRNDQRGYGITSGAMWHIVSPGPDGNNCFGGGTTAQTGFHAGGVDYDPSNGTVSAGDIVRVASAPGIFAGLLPKYDRVAGRTN
jgi:prepilin-type N-terminal cleavage/methylation domain-containing protein